MSVIVVLAVLAFLMFAAYRGYSVILFTSLAVFGAVLLTNPPTVAPMPSGIFTEKMVGLVKLYFPVFLLGAVFGKVIELSGFSRSIIASAIRVVGAKRVMLSIVLMCALLTYGGASLFAVVFAVYSFVVEMFRQSNIPKCFIPGTITLGAFPFAMDSLPGMLQIQNVTPTTFLRTTSWATSWLGTIGALFIIVMGMPYLEWRRHVALRYDQGYDHGLTRLANEPETAEIGTLAHPLVVSSPPVLAGMMNLLFTRWIPTWHGKVVTVALPGLSKPLTAEVDKLTTTQVMEAVLLIGIVVVPVFSFRVVKGRFTDGSKAAVLGALPAAMSTASEYGLGGVIAALPGFLVLADGLRVIPNPFANEAVTVNTLAGITDSASGGMSIALTAVADRFVQAAQAAGIPMEVLHRVVMVASGGMDTLPYNGAAITLLVVTGPTHREVYRNVLYVTITKTLAVFFVITVFYAIGIV